MKKPLPGLTGVRATQLPPLDESAFKRTRKSTFSKSTLSATNQRAASQALFLGVSTQEKSVHGLSGLTGDGAQEDGMLLTTQTNFSNINANPSRNSENVTK